ncbi:MAG: type II secretion system minor pseudopilin GspK [Betaproteobacteria bacterium]|nr:type II secretion system minor pseudopilin GspK [Betaproteobacteria bacterium]
MAVRERGVAVVMALVTVALAATAAATMLYRAHVWARDLELTADAAQARQSAVAAVARAAEALRDDGSRTTVDHARSAWNAPLSPGLVEGGVVEARIVEQQGLFNLNNLLRHGSVDSAAVARYRTLLTLLRLPVELADSLTDWMDADIAKVSRFGAEDEDYLRLSPPYRAANRPLARLGELARVKGYTDEVVAVLGPFVTVLPDGTAVNVNTAPAEVLAAVIDGLTLVEARTAVAQRNPAYYKDVADFRARLPRAAELKAGEGLVTVTSSHFRVTALVRRNDVRVRTEALLYRAQRESWPVTVAQTMD